MAGRLDRRTVHLFNDGISTLLLTDRTAWVINANELTACDYAGLLAINDACRRAHLHNRRVTLTAAPVPLRWHLTQLRDRKSVV